MKVRTAFLTEPVLYGDSEATRSSRSMWFPSMSKWQSRLLDVALLLRNKPLLSLRDLLGELFGKVDLAELYRE